MNLSKKALFTAALLIAGVTYSQAQLVIDVDAGGAMDDTVNGGVYDFFFTVPALSGTLTDVQLRLSLTYNQGGTSAAGATDLSATLIGPNGAGSPTAITISSTGGTAIQSFSITLNNTRFADGGSANFGTDSASSPVGSEPYPPEDQFFGVGGAFNAVTASTAAGQWHLVIQDANSFGTGDSGTLFRDAAVSGQGTELILAGVTAVPEPTTYAMIFGLGALGFAAVRRFRKA